MPLRGVREIGWVNVPEAGDWENEDVLNEFAPPTIEEAGQGVPPQSDLLV